MSFWTGFFAGIAATYAFSIVVAVLLFRPRRQYAELPPRASASCPEYPTVHFTHLTRIGEHVQGSDD